MFHVVMPMNQNVEKPFASVMYLNAAEDNIPRKVCSRGACA